MRHLASRCMRRGIAAFASLALVVPAVVGALALTTASPASAGGHDAKIFAYGATAFAGSPSTTVPLAGMTGTADGRGYWVTRSDGVVYAYGTAVWYGDARSHPPGAPVIGMVATPSGHGYWLALADGGVFTYGDAHFYGSAFSYLAGSVVSGIASTPSGQGYWLTSTNGGVFTFGDARFYGSAFGYLAGSYATSIAATRDGLGYWVTAANGGIFTFGDAHYYGSAFGHTAGALVSVARTPSGQGYFLLDAAGNVFAYGDAPWRGSVTGYVGYLRHAITVATYGVNAGYWVLTDAIQANGVIATIGTRGPAANAVQSALLSHGFWLVPTGVYDDVTQQAVYAFQKTVGLPRTGVFTGVDWSVLSGLARPKPRSTSGTVVEVDLARQILIFGVNGTATWIFNTSTGSGQPYSYGGHSYVAITPTGHFSVIRQVDGLDISHLGTLWRPKYFTWDGVAIHGSPSIPPYPASHGCVRVSDSAIDFMWANNMLPIGAQVWVY